MNGNEIPNEDKRKRKEQFAFQVKTARFCFFFVSNDQCHHYREQKVGLAFEVSW